MLTEITATSDAEPFTTPVDIEGYLNVVPVPMDLGLILRRLEKVRMRC